MILSDCVGRTVTELFSTPGDECVPSAQHQEAAALGLDFLIPDAARLRSCLGKTYLLNFR